jgi:hypothetical protein
MLKTAGSIIVGTLLGIIGARYVFVGSWLSLIPWGIVGLAIGYWGDRRAAMTNGAAYGFILAFAYSGAASLLSRLPFFAILGLFGAICGFILGLLGFLLKGYS